MSALASLQRLGLSLSVSFDGKLILDGLKKLPREDRKQALSLAKGNKAAIIEALCKAPRCEAAPTPDGLAHARRMLVVCPSAEGQLHCWYCSRCSMAAGCRAWRRHRADVAFFKRSEPPYSLFLVESGSASEGTLEDVSQ